MKNLLIISALLSLFASCTAQQKTAYHQRVAQRKLAAAIRHDPTIIARQYTDTLIQGFVRSINDIQIAGMERSSGEMDADSLLREINKLVWRAGDSSKSAPALYLYKDSAASISVRKEKSGRVSVAFTVQPRTIHDDRLVPYAVRVSVPGKVVKQSVALPCWKYFWFWALLLYAALATYLFIRGRVRSR